MGYGPLQSLCHIVSIQGFGDFAKCLLNRFQIASDMVRLMGMGRIKSACCQEALS